MAATYDISTHGLLSGQAANLQTVDSAAFDVLAEMAETILNVHDTSYTGDELTRVKYALVRQVNFMLEITPESQLAAMVVRGSRTTTYKSGAPPEIDTLARRIVAELGVTIGSESSFPVLRSLR